MRAEGVATYRLGVACANLGDRAQSIEFQQRYLVSASPIVRAKLRCYVKCTQNLTNHNFFAMRQEICKRVGDQVGEGAASAALAHSFKLLGDQKLALKYLETFLEISKRTKQARSEAEACTGLGTIYSSLGEHAKAVSFFEQTFEIARTLGDRRLMDGARINLGMARGNVSMNGFMNTVINDMDGLLAWKTKRVKFTEKDVDGSGAASRGGGGADSGTKS